MRNSKNLLNASVRRTRIAVISAACALAACVLPATALGATDTTQFSVTPGALQFGTTPNAPNFSALNLNGSAQTLNATMANYSVADATGSGSGYNVTVIGDTAGGKSPVFKQYCDNGGSACGGTPANSYVSGGATLAANSLTLNSTSATFSAQGGTTGTQPTHSCNAGCFVDSAGAVKTISAAVGAGMGTWLTANYSATSLALATPSNISVLPANQVYHVDLVWTANTGP
jgi:hypothetical protein